MVEQKQIVVKCASTLDEIATLEKQWEHLHRNAARASFYNTFDFIYEAVRAFAIASIPLKVFSLWLKQDEENALIAVFPWQSYKDRWWFLSYNMYEYIGLEEVDKPYPIIHKDYLQDCWSAILTYLQHEESGWDMLQLIEFPQDEKHNHAIENACANDDLRLKILPDTSGPVIHFKESWEDFWSAHPKMRRKVKKMEKDFSENISFVIENVDSVSAVKQYAELEQKSWKKGKVGVSKNHKTLDFYNNLAAKAAEKNKIFFGFLCVDGVPVSAEIAYVHGDTAYFCHGCYDDAYKKYSPGMVSTSYFLQYFFAKDVRYGDFLCGYAGYLNAWADEQVVTQKLQVFANNPKMKCISMAQKLKRAVLERFSSPFNSKGVGRGSGS